MSRLRFVCIALLAVVLLAGGLIVVIWSTTFVQTRLAGWALGSLQQRFGIVGHATRVELDLSRLALTVEGLSLAAEDHLDQPFFTVDHARVDLPWSSLWSDFSLQEVALVHPQVTVVTAADGVSNLPSGGNEEDGDFAGPPAQVSIGSLDIRDLTVDWQDDALPMRLTIGPTTLSLTSEGASIAGPLHLDGGAVPESDIVSVLLTGQTLSESGADGGLGAREQALGLVSAELLGSAGRDLGLRLRIGEETGASGQIRFDSSLVANDLDPTTRLTVGRQLNDQVTLIASQDLRSSDVAWIIDYLPLEDIEIRGLFSGDNNRAYEFRHALELGYPPSHTDMASGSRRAAAELPVEFVGETGFPAETLREVIRLRSGARFDFFRWQDDQDRLEQFYTERGYRQVRLRARRIEMPEVVSLEYDITRGPLTHLVVKGFDAPSSLRRALERAWERSVLDAFLLEEVRTLVRGHLSDLGFLRAKVDVAIDNTDNPREKTLTTTVAVGPQTTQREVVLNGSDAIDEETLWTFVTERELDSAVWSDPQSLEDSLVGLYRSLGWLEASVVVEEPVFEGAEARLPVRIEEGRRFSLGSVTLSGVAARSEQEALDVLGLTPGEPYLAPDIQAARGALERSYRDAGFSAARVSAEPTLDANQGTIGVEIRVREGLQQVVEDVVVVGRARSRPTLVTNALRITPGELVDLSEWNLARRRLYDTGVFRTVDIQADPVESEVPGELEAVRARVVLEELPVYSFRYGLSITDQEPLETDAGRDLGLAFATDFSRRNLLGRGITAGVSAKASRRQNAIRGYLGTTQFFGLPLATSLYAENRQETSGEENAEFATHRRTVAFEQRIGRADRVSYAYSASFDRNRTFDKDPDPTFPFDIMVNILRFTGSVPVDSRDNLFDASNGWFHSSTTEYGFEPGEGAIRFVKYFAQQYHYWPVGPIVLASAARLGLGSGLGAQVIRSERFFAGGGNTVRGYGQDSLGPHDFFGATGGNALLVFNQEVRSRSSGGFAGSASSIRETSSRRFRTSPLRTWRSAPVLACVSRPLSGFSGSTTDSPFAGTMMNRPDGSTSRSARPSKLGAV